MTPPLTSDTPDPNTLIATILLHLPTFQNKPGIAAAAFQTIRKASQTSNVQQISYSLLLPITALSLNSKSATVRSHARNICILFLRCLVLRRLRNVVAIYVEDIVQLFKNIVAHQNNEYVQCNLPNFILATTENVAANKNHPQLEKEVLQLPVNSTTLESLLHLFALLIPSSLSIQQPRNDVEKVKQNHSFSVKDITPDAIKLWHCLGGRAQAKVLSLATNQALLAGQCGYDVAGVAVHIWERAFDPGACYIVPPCLRESLCIVANQVLRESYALQIDDRSVDVRAGLYRLCQLSDNLGMIDGKTWSECGIREAAQPNTDLGLQLRSLSKSGLVQSYILESEAVKKEECLEPPLKKRRVENFDDSASFAPERTLESGERTQNTASEYHRLTVNGLFKSVKALPSTDICATDPQCLTLLANACSLTADSICNIVVEGGHHVEPVREWLSFASSLSHIGQDIMRTRKDGPQNRPLGAAAIFARACLHLGSVLTQLKSQLVQKRSMENIDGTEFVDTTNMALLSVVVNVLSLGSACEEDSENPYPASQFADLAMDVIVAIREERIHTTGILRALKTCCERFLHGMISGTLRRETTWVILRAVLQMSRCLKAFQPDPATRNFHEDICSYISNFNSTEELSVDCLAVLEHVICFKVQCEHLHEIGQCRSEEVICEESPRLDEETWKTIFTALKKLRDNIREDAHLPDLFNCAGVLTIHCPHAREHEALGFFKSFMDNTSTAALSPKIKLFPVLLERSEQAVMRDSCGFDTVLIDEDHLLEASQALPAPGSARKKKMGHYSTFGLEVSHRAQKYMFSTEDKQVELSYLAIFGSLLCSSHQVLASRIFGPSVTGLLVRASKDLHQISLDESKCIDAQTRSKFFLDESVPCTLSAWNHILMTASLESDQFRLQASCANTALRKRHSLFEQQRAPCQKRTLCSLVCDLLNPRLREFIPYCVKQLLREPGFAERMEEMVSEGNQKFFWVRVSRDTVVHLLKERDQEALEELAEKVQRPMKTLVERASADALALSFMTETSGLKLKTDGFHRLILELLEVSLGDIVRKKFGKIVQRLVMEFGGPKEASAKHGLVALSTFMPNRRNIDPSMGRIAGILITSNFMLVMDAVNRGLFNSKATSQERRRHLIMLEVVLALSSDQLHLFVPKVMATLKMALDVNKADNVVYRQTLTLWKNFLKLLGPQRLVPHIGTVFAILMPVRFDQGSMLQTELGNVLTSIKPEEVGDKPSLLLLLRIMRQVIFHDGGYLNNSVYRWNKSDKQLSIQELHGVCKNVESIIGHHENESIEVYASQYLLCVLRSNRHALNKVLFCAADLSRADRQKDFGMVASMLEILVSQLSKTKSIDCQDILIQCIGEIGAIDPGLLPQNRKERLLGLHHSRLVRPNYPKSVHGFAAVLLDDFLVVALRKGEKQESSKSQFNRVGLVIQELLRLCGCNRSTPIRANVPCAGESPRRAEQDWESILARLPKEEKAILFWESLSSTSRDAVQPYLAEPFDVSQYLSIFGENSERNAEPACQPVWSKVRALVPLGRRVTAQEWIRQMTVQLVDFIGRQGQFGELLRALRPILRYEDQLNNHIFPLVVTTALDLQHSLQMSEVKEFLIREIKEVLVEATSPQSVFDLLDTLRAWRDRRSEKRGAETYMSNYSRPIEASEAQILSRTRIPVEKFMDIAVANDPLTGLVDLYGRGSSGLSLLTQARAALASRSHHRAIMLAEYHIRNTRAKTGFPGWPSYIEMLRGRARKGDLSRSNSETEALEVAQVAGAVAIIKKSLVQLTWLAG
ncbi:unnamed protein product [Agarophyton chilense]